MDRQEWRVTGREAALYLLAGGDHHEAQKLPCSFLGCAGKWSRSVRDEVLSSTSDWPEGSWSVAVDLGPVQLLELAERSRDTADRQPGIIHYPHLTPTAIAAANALHCRDRNQAVVAVGSFIL